jgi:hypothetical protein
MIVTESGDPLLTRYIVPWGILLHQGWWVRQEKIPSIRKINEYSSDSFHKYMK